MSQYDALNPVEIDGNTEDWCKIDFAATAGKAPEVTVTFMVRGSVHGCWIRGCPNVSEMVIDFNDQSMRFCGEHGGIILDTIKSFSCGFSSNMVNK